MFSKPQNHHKPTPRPNFNKISNSFNIKKHAQPLSTLRIPQQPNIKLEKNKKHLNFGKLGLHPRKLGDPPKNIEYNFHKTRAKLNSLCFWPQTFSIR